MKRANRIMYVVMWVSLLLVAIQSFGKNWEAFWIECVLMVWTIYTALLEYKHAESEVLLNMYRREYEKRAEMYRDVMAGAERCVICGAVIPEGRMVCPRCERVMDHGNL